MKNIDWQRAETDIEYRKAVNIDLALTNALLDRRSVELECTRKVLREICRDYGDNDWPENCYVPDILEKHLWRHFTVAKLIDNYPGGTNCNGLTDWKDLNEEIEYANWETQGYREPVHKS